MTDEHATRRCHKCGAEIDAQVSFCPACGERTRLTKCPHCGTSPEENWLFCGVCGRSLTEDSDQGPEPEASPRESQQADPSGTTTAYDVDTGGPCPKCGHVNQSHRRLCFRCSAVLDPANTDNVQFWGIEAQHTAATEATAAGGPNSRRKLLTWVGSVGFLIILLALFMRINIQTDYGFPPFYEFIGTWDDSLFQFGEGGWFQALEESNAERESEREEDKERERLHDLEIACLAGGGQWHPPAKEYVNGRIQRSLDGRILWSKERCAN